MLRWIPLFMLFSSTLFAAEPWAPARDYWGPQDTEGFLQPILPPASPESTISQRPDLQVMAINKKGFLHRSRRQAEPLNPEPLDLREYARIYSPSQSFVALKHGDTALMILHSHTSISVRPGESAWQFTFTGERGLARISTRGHALPITLKPADPQTAWRNVELLLNPDSDLYLKYDREALIAYTIRGQVLYRLEATRPLQAARPQGLLLEWEQKQLRADAKMPYEIKVFAGQELRMKADAAYTYHIGLPHSDTWQSALVRTSPQLAEAVDSAQPLTAALLDLRKSWLKNWAGNAPPNKETLYRLMQEARWEEAYELLRTFQSEADLEYQALAAVCLYRLQQQAHADKKQESIDRSSLWAEITRQEFLRSRLRRKARVEVNPPEDFRHAGIPTEELYLLATNEQARGRWRAALDLWERWPESGEDPLLQASYKEWQSHLDRKKPWSYTASLELGWSDNVLHLPSGLAAPADIGHRSSWLLRSTQKLPYLVERSDDFSVHLEPSLQFSIYQHTGLTDLQRYEPGLSLPLRMLLPFARQSIQLKPYISRLMQGSGGLDRFGYELNWSSPTWTLAPEFFLAQEQNLDFAPTRDHRLDALTGERVGMLDRSVRLHTLGIRSGSVEALWQKWDYRYTGSEQDDRQRMLLRGMYQKEFPYDLQLKLWGSLHQDLFQGSRSAVTGLHIHVELGFLYWHRWQPSLALERSMRQSGDKEQSFTETLILSGVQYRW